MPDLPFQTDVRVNLPNELRSKSTIALSPTGDILLVTGRDKLVTQMMRAIINDDNPVSSVINNRSVTSRTLTVLINTILRGFRANQVKYVNESDPDLSGYSVWRKAAGTDDAFVRVSDKAVIWRFTDTGLTNEIVYTYAVSRVYKGIFETKFVDTIDITPSSFLQNQEIKIGQYVALYAGSKQVLIYVDYNKKFKGSELLEKIVDISVSQDETDPRRWAIHAKIEDYLGQLVSVSTGPNMTL